DLVSEVAVQVVHGIAPRDQVHAQAGALAEDPVEMVGRAGLFFPAREAEFILAAAEVAEPGQVVDEKEQLRAIAAGLLAPLDLGGQFGEDSPGVPPAPD